MKTPNTLCYVIQSVNVWTHTEHCIEMRWCLGNIGVEEHQPTTVRRWYQRWRIRRNKGEAHCPAWEVCQAEASPVCAYLSTNIWSCIRGHRENTSFWILGCNKLIVLKISCMVMLTHHPKHSVDACRVQDLCLSISSQKASQNERCITQSPQWTKSGMLAL